MRWILTAIGSLALVACGEPDRGPKYRAAGSETPRRGGTMTFSTYTNIRTLDPAIAYDEQSIYALYYLYDTLVDYEPDGPRLVPWLAESWTVSPDGLTYAFTLRPGITYSDGRPIVAADFATAWKRVLRLADSPFGQFLDAVEGASAYGARERDDVPGIRVVDDRHLEVRLTHPDAAFIYVLAMKFAAPLRADFVAVHGDGLRSVALASGPFELVEWSEGEQVRFRRNVHYWQPHLPYLDGLVMKENVPRDTAFLMFERGELDAVDRLAAPDWLWISGREDWAPYVHTMAQMSVYGSRMNVEVAPFDDVRVRRALNHAVNKEHLVKLQNRLAVPSHGILPPGMPGRDDAIEPYPYDPAKARALLAEAGYPDGFSVEYVTIKDDNAEKIAQSLQHDLAEVGVRMQIVIMSWATYLDATGSREGAKFSMASWLQDYPDASNFLDVRFHSRMIADVNSNNDSFYVNAELDGLLDAARRELDQGEREAMYRRVEQILYDDAPWIWQYHPVVMEVVQPYVKGFILHPVLVRDFRQVWLDLDEDGRRVPR
jgi:peptide/nickel transport system substrate-binding protein/oligopeptide transport system substrate-binding protein